MHDTVTASYLWLIPALPLLGVLLNATLGARLGRGLVAVVAPAVVGGAFAVSLVALTDLLGRPAGSALVNHVYPWIHAGSLQLDIVLRVDPLSAVMILVVTGVGFLIHVYSVGYMAHEPDYARYFTYLNLFTFSMLVLVLADNLPLLFVGWEGVGLCSYLLIGFWYTKDENASAGKKAFVVNRIGDAGFLLGMFLIYWHLGTGVHSFSFGEVAARVREIPLGIVTIAALLLFVGATGKSAQLPLYVWLPDAMAGPTPVSALIHAATMVTAGVYMIARLNFLYVLTPTAMTVVAWIGALTALFAATIGLAQNDIKKVLAYSTISQLGYMFLAVGVGAFSAGIFHLMTHAFFKALLFLGAGSVIHGMSGEQDMQKMGGLRRHMPITFGTLFLANLAIAGIPPFAGFFSKDEILLHAFTGVHGSVVLWLLGAMGAGLTAFYMYRLLFLTFYGECRAEAEVAHHIHESPSSMTVPLVILAVLSVAGGWIGLPAHWLWGNRFGEFLAPVFGHHEAEHVSAAVEYGLMAVSVLVAAAGIGLAYFFYVVQPALPMIIAWRAGRLYDLIFNKYYIDEFYDAAVVQPIHRASVWLWRVWDVLVVDGLVNGTASAVAANSGLWRLLQTGNVQHYALSFLLGAVAILGYYAWW
ncbi:MAG: NADH-quinone oxidoreductase subunit L [Deltaproteobacteria bacterium]|nr:NADH-quinone oxidoreductase subunit L [Deltaproteobacteria bacterium]